jgi:tight adherence protein C
LLLAGWDDSLDANSWAAIRIFSVAGSLVFFFLLPSDLSTLTRTIALILLAVAGFILPEAILNRNIEARREQMRRELPEILDLLVISVEAGLSFDAALARVVESVPGLMSEEFNRMLQETRVGVSRRDAMENLAGRTDLDELQSFLLAMNQADAFGVSIVRVLRVQADEMRTRRRVRAQEKAFAAPVKMVFPLVLCIFPALFIVLVGPAAVQIQDAIINR